MTVDVRPVGEDEWPVVAWLWQAYRTDMAPVVHGLPYSDGRFAHAPLDTYPAPDRAGWLLWSPHPNTGEPAPIGFALVSGLHAARRTVDGFWVASAVRRLGVGRAFALDVLRRYDGPWEIAFQHDNAGAGPFWRSVARAAWGEGWTEEQRPVPGRPDVPPDHWVTSR
ncbi:MAG: GNAT family N-acetyltransferase [Marmoricola sp.]